MGGYDITHSEAMELFRYDEADGCLYWLKDRKSVAKAGSKVGCVHHTGYLKTKVKGKNLLVHRLIWFLVHGEWPSDKLDHINGDKRDNRINNLREATQSQNRCNSKLQKNNTSGYKGVSYNKVSGKYMAGIQVNKKPIYLGLYDTPEQAYQAYCDAAKEHHGEYARLK